jgi:hypothetical protein
MIRIIRTMRIRAQGVIPTSGRAVRVYLLAGAAAGGLAIATFAQTPAPANSAASQAAALLRGHRLCVVPPLRGDTLVTARRALSTAHCRLGSVHEPARHHDALRVTRQSARAGKRLAKDTRVSLWVGFTQHKGPSSTGQTIYVANSGNSSITEYTAKADGNVSPTSTISGSNTDLSSPDGLAVDASGTIYVADFSGARITEYASGASGDVAPVRTISGARTTLGNPWGVGVNTLGTLYVTNSGGSGIVEFVSGASGDVAPVRTISGANTLLYEAWGITFDASGQAYVSNGSSINNAVTEYSPEVSGDVSPNSSISGSNTELSAPNGEAFDSSGTLYVCNNGRANSVTAYASGAAGNASPLRMITGVSTRLNGCSGLAVH